MSHADAPVRCLRSTDSSSPGRWCCCHGKAIDECYASLECLVADTRMVNRCGLFVLEVVRAAVDHSAAAPRTMHRRGWGEFMVAGGVIWFESATR